MHTLVIGTSKSKNVDAYYIEAKDKFWSSLYQSGFTEREYRPEEYRNLLEQGVGFGELAFNHQYKGQNDSNAPFTQDKHLNEEIDAVKNGILELIKFIRLEQIQNLVFNGKTALSCFLEFNETGSIEAVNSAFLRTKNYSYGKCCQWEGKDIYLMPNLSSAANKEWKSSNGFAHWVGLWEALKPVNNTTETPKKSKELQGDKKKKTQLSPKQKMFLGIFLFVFSTLMLLGYLLLTKDLIRK